MQPKHRGQSPAAIATGGEGEGLPHGLTPGGQSAVILRSAGKDDLADCLQSRNQSGRGDSPNILESEADRDRFAGVDRPVGWPAAFFEERKIGRIDD